MLHPASKHRFGSITPFIRANTASRGHDLLFALHPVDQNAVFNLMQTVSNTQTEMIVAENVRKDPQRRDSGGKMGAEKELSCLIRFSVIRSFDCTLSTRSKFDRGPVSRVFTHKTLVLFSSEPKNAEDDLSSLRRGRLGGPVSGEIGRTGQIRVPITGSKLNSKFQSLSCWIRDVTQMIFSGPVHESATQDFACQLNYELDKQRRRRTMIVFVARAPV
ncbi:hypothetical protein L596_011887 [Steinernema carpocapsae]|uniref:Uncharacterized protein n=1 Tax=Steinernema carpocapsae TaxID=34508 RepID=A0A4U5NVF4_STECR|nr:hypothetical protein L596_011887 [Steinernema carpocapsae]